MQPVGMREGMERGREGKEETEVEWQTGGRKEGMNRRGQKETIGKGIRKEVEDSREKSRMEIEYEEGRNKKCKEREEE